MAVDDDQGHEAWSITGLTQAQQYAYYSAPLIPSQQADAKEQGFVFTVQARVQQNVAPFYTTQNPYVIGVFSASIGSRRFDIDLGIDSNGDTVVVLADNVYGSGNMVVAPGANFTLSGSGSMYHSYQLIYNPTTHLANLFIDGVDSIQNYAGFAYPTTGSYGLYLSGINGGQVSFDSVHFTSSPVPLPASALLLGSGIIGLTGLRRRIARKGRKEEISVKP